MIKQSEQPGGLQVVGHRGARGLAPENTVAAIHKGLEHGADQIEIDVRLTRDGIAVLHHDADLRDPTTARYPIRHHNFDELRQHKSDLATLEEAIMAVNRQVPLYIEVKPGEPTLPIIKIVQIFLSKGWHEHDFVLGSKSQRTLLTLHRSLPALPTIVIESWSGVRASWRARRLGTRRIAMRGWWLWSGFIRSMHAHGYQLYAYTVNDPRQARRWFRYGLAGIVTDYPDRFAPSPSTHKKEPKV